MKIGIVCYATVGGSGIVATELAKALAARGHDIHVLSTDTPFRLGDFQPGLAFHRVRRRRTRSSASRSTSSRSRHASSRSRASIGSTSCTRTTRCRTPPRRISRSRSCSSRRASAPQIVTTLHGTDITLVGSDRSYSETVAFSIEHSDGVTAVSESLRSDTYRVLKVHRDIAVIPNFLDCAVHWRTAQPLLRTRHCPPRLREARRARLQLPAGEARDAVIDIFARIAAQVPSRLLLVGDGPDLGDALYRARELGIADRVDALGEQDPVTPLLSISDLFLLPSAQESFGLSALEAMACEVPVIASRVGGLPEVVEHGVTGFLHAPDDVEGMAASGIALLTDPDLHASFVERGREAVTDRFCSDLIVPQYETFYESLIGDAGSGRAPRDA